MIPLLHDDREIIMKQIANAWKYPVGLLLVAAGAGNAAYGVSMYANAAAAAPAVSLPSIDLLAGGSARVPQNILLASAQQAEQPGVAARKRVPRQGAAFQVGENTLVFAAGGSPQLLGTNPLDDPALRPVAERSYNFGALMEVDEQTRVGLLYRSQGKRGMDDPFSLSALANSDIVPLLTPGSDAVLPDALSSGVVYRLDDQFDVSAGLTLAGLDAMQNLGVVAPAAVPAADKWRNNWRGAIGATQYYDEQWSAHMGLAYDRTSASAIYRTDQVSDQDHTWFSLGGEYKLAKDSALNFGYTHLYSNNMGITQGVGTGSGLGSLLGSSGGSVNIYSLQYGHHF